MKYAQNYILPYLKKYKLWLFSTLFLGALAVLSAAMLTFTSGYLISRAAQRPETILLIYIPIVAVRTFGISRAVFRYLERLFGHDAVLKILADMRVQLYRLLEPQALFIRSRYQTGDLLGTLADDVEHLQDVYIRTIFPTLIALFLFLFLTISLAVFDWLFAVVIALCLSLVTFIYPFLSLIMMKKWQIEAKAQHSQLYSKLTDALFGLTDWLISGRKESFIHSFMHTSRISQASERKLAYWHQARSLQLQIFSGLIVIGVGLWAGWQAGEGNILPTYIAAFTLVTIPIMEALLPVSFAVERIPAYQESLKRIELIEQYQGTDCKKNLHRDIKQEVDLFPQKVDIRLDSVSYSYTEQTQTTKIEKVAEARQVAKSELIPEAEHKAESAQIRDAVHRFSLTIPQGHKIAILGRSGAGKSTLMHLLLGAIEPREGQVLIGGKSASAYGEQIHDLVGVLNQKPYLFATTVENNLRLGKAKATHAEIEDVITQVQLSEYIHSLPKGIETQMEETGQRFSGGERQRIALARILLQDTPIVILDEPTVGLDPVTEYALIETILTTLKEKTVVWITHHLAGMNKMDKILFLDKGQIALSGTHKELLATNERYRNLYQLDSGI